MVALRFSIRRAMTLFVSAAWLACGGPTARDEPGLWAVEVAVESLRTALVDAAVQVEPGLIDLGTYHARPHLRSGWSYNESQAGTTFSWGLGSSSVLGFFLTEARPLRLDLRGWPFPQSGAAGVTVTVRLNGQEIDSLRLQGGPSEVGVTLPATAVRVGDNRLELDYSAFRAPAAGSEDGRRLAVAWDWIRFADRSPAMAPMAIEDDLVFLPAGSRVDYYLDLPAEAVLRLDSLIAAEGRYSRLRIAIEWEGKGENDLFEGRLGQEFNEVPPTSMEFSLGASGGLARVRFEVPPEVAGEPSDSGERRPGVVLESPRIESRRRDPDGGHRLAPDAEPRGEPRPSGRSGSTSGDSTSSDGYREPTSRPHVILYLVDTLRADHLGVYGSARDTSPNIDAFAAESIVFERAVAQSSWTKAAVASIFTGLWPPEHGTLDVDAVVPANLPTAATLFQAAGYRTGAVVANAFVSEVFGFDRGFEEFVFFADRFVLSDALHARALRWLDEVARDESEAPVFLYLHTIDPHAPYDPPTEFRRRFAPRVRDPDFGSIATVDALKNDELPVDAKLIEDLVSLYDADIAHNDQQFGRFLDAMRERGIYDNAVIVFVADHGEAFHEHGRWTHGLDLHSEVVHVPLIVHLPGNTEGERRDEVAQQIDILPTLLDAAGLDPATGSPGRGRSLLRPVDPASPRPRPIFSHMTYFGEDWVSVEWGRWKLIRPLGVRLGEGLELYDRGHDPAELHNVAPEQPVVTGYLATLIRRELRRARTPESSRTEIDPATRNQLEALGYLQ